MNKDQLVKENKKTAENFRELRNGLGEYYRRENLNSTKSYWAEYYEGGVIFYSYSTPILIKAGSSWIANIRQYSSTTSKHFSKDFIPYKEYEKKSLESPFFRWFWYDCPPVK